MLIITVTILNINLDQLIFFKFQLDYIFLLLSGPSNMELNVRVMCT